MLDIDETILDRNPLIKRRSFFHDPRFPEAYAADLPRALRIIAEKSDYNPELIWRNVVRKAELRILNTNAGLTSIIPDVRVSKKKRDYGNVAICAHVYYVEMLDELLRHTDTIPIPYDFIATTETAEKKARIEERLQGHGKIRNVIVRVVEQNRGRDMSSLFITCRDLFLDDRYDLVCRLHTKKSPQVHPGRGNLFKRHMLENLLNTPGFTANVLDMFYDKPWIGVAVPPVVQISYWTMGHAWYTNREKAAWVRELLDLKIQPDPYTPIAAYGTMFWFRPKALRKLFAHPWKWEDFNPEPHHIDSGLAHALERTICYAAQDAGYTTEQILSCHLAGWNYAVLEYKLQRLSAAFPSADFNHQCLILEQRAAAGVPTIDVIHTAPAPIPEPIEPPPPLDSQNSAAYQPTNTYVEHQPTIRTAGALFFRAVKRSFVYRYPTLSKSLQPFYRTVIRKKSSGHLAR
jgi:rhamnosyltransferase